MCVGPGKYVELVEYLHVSTEKLYMRGKKVLLIDDEHLDAWGIC